MDERLYAKEKSAMEYLKANEIDLELLFYKMILDREFSIENLEGRYVEEYNDLGEDAHWELAERTKRLQNQSVDTWNGLVEHVMWMMETLRED